VNTLMGEITNLIQDEAPNFLQAVKLPPNIHTSIETKIVIGSNMPRNKKKGHKPAFSAANFFKDLYSPLIPLSPVFETPKLGQALDENPIPPSPILQPEPKDQTLDLLPPPTPVSHLSTTPSAQMPLDPNNMNTNAHPDNQSTLECVWNI
ncbi:hypothetical protein FRB99_004539, partial [Tulasnella sp. 403]